MRSARTPIPASAIGLAVCLSLLAAPPAALQAAPVGPDATVRLTGARAQVHEWLANLREAVRRLSIQPAARLHRAAPPTLVDAARTAHRPAPRYDRAAGPTLSARLARLINLPPPAAD